MVEKEQLRVLCNDYDKYYELEGKKQEDLRKSLLVRLEEGCLYIMNRPDEVFHVNVGWMIWMYGKLAHGQGNEDILKRYNESVVSFDKNARVLAERNKFTTMYQVATYLGK
jgi:hypothetical protein